MALYKLAAVLVVLVAHSTQAIPAVDSSTLLPTSDSTSSASTASSSSSGATSSASSTGKSAEKASASSDTSSETEEKHKRTTPVIHHHAKKHHTIKHHKEHRHAGSHNNEEYKSNNTYNASAVYDVCEDTDPNWRNKDGLTCKMYTDAWCTGTGFKPYSTGYAGASYDYPEKVCCSCGGGKAKPGQSYSPASTAAASDDWTENEVDTDTCQDKADWKNQYGLDCDAYSNKGYCKDGAVAKGMDWAIGAAYNYPEANCCECGGGDSLPSKM